MPTHRLFGKITPFVFTFLAGAIVAGLSGTVSVLAHGQVDLIRSCVNKKSGEIRILLGYKKCSHNEYALEWNKQGVQGLIGPQGPAGPQGIQGIPGKDASENEPSRNYVVCTACTQKQILERLGAINLINAQLDFAVLSDAKLQNVDMSGGSFKKTLFPVADVQNSNLSNSDLSDSYWHNALLNDANLTNTNFIRADFTEAQLTGATTTGAIFTNAIWHHTNCPDGTNSDNNGGTCEGHF